MSGGNLFVLTAVQLALTAVPSVAAVLVAVRLGARSEPVLLALALVTGGAAAMLTFWVYFAVPGAGASCAYLVFFGSIALIAWIWQSVSQQGDLLRRLAAPLGLWALGSVFMVFFGFLHGGTEVAAETAAYRFSTEPSQFASDNFIPWFYAEWMFAGNPGPAPIFEPEWHFSDRPPLQVGYILTQHVFGWDGETLRYELIGVLLQQLWIVALWALLTAARVSTRTRALVMVGALVSDVAIVHSFYVWPKLLGAAFVIAALALLVDPREATLRSRPWTVILLGGLTGLAALSHGTGVFGLIPIAAFAIWRGLPSWRWLAAGAAALLVLVIPWMAYQQYGDPPANRLLKWHLAGAPDVDERGTAEAILDEYGKIGIAGALDNKYDNFLQMAGGDPDIGPPAPGQKQFGNAVTETVDAIGALAEGRFGTAASKVRETRYWHLLWTVGLMMLAVPLIVIGRLRGRWRDGEDWRFARLCLLFLGVGVFCWGLLMFGNVAGRTVVAQGSLAMPLVMIAGLVAGLRATYPRWADWLVGANVVTVFVLYLPTIPARPGGASYSAFALIAALAALGAFSMLAFSSRIALRSLWKPSTA